MFNIEFIMNYLGCLRSLGAGIRVEGILLSSIVKIYTSVNAGQKKEFFLLGKIY